MSEMTAPSNTRNELHRLLLISVSSVALLASARAVQAASDDESRPTVWIELGGQLERLDEGLDAFTPPFAAKVTSDGLASPLTAQRPARYSNGFDGKLSFQPENSDWSFSAAMIYGRSNAARRIHQEKQIPPSHWSFSYGGQVHPQTAKLYADYTDDRIKNDESHAVLDFQAGKDVGLGMFGHGGSATVEFGVRIAQFSSQADAVLYARPDGHFAQHKFGFVFNTTPKYAPFGQYHNYGGMMHAARSFKGVGPSISWNASTPLIGQPQGAEFTLDWGANAAFLFGRQKAIIHHHSSQTYHYAITAYRGGILVYAKAENRYSQNVADPVRSRTVAVPNIGGFLGASARYSSVKFSLGYRADFFFGAMDGGIDTHRNENIGFYGPFASVSVGLGG